MSFFHPKQIFTDRRSLAAFVISLSLFLNIVLTLTKYFIYLKTNLIGAKLDSISGLVDILCALIALFSFIQLLSFKAKGSQYGYGRIEYVATLIMSILILGLGCYYLGSSINRYPFPSFVNFTQNNMVLLIVIVFIKIGLGVAYRFINKVIRSGVFRVFEIVCYLSGFITFLTSISYILSNKYSVGIDAIISTFESLFIIGAGFIIAIDSIRSLIGRDPDAALKYKITKTVKNNKKVLALGKMILHDYGLDHIEGTLEVSYDYEFSDDIYYANKEIEEDIFRESGVKISIIAIPKAK